MKVKKPCAVLIHGHHLQAPNWEVFVWGTDNLEQVGRIPRGVEVAVKEEAGLIIWGAGGSEDPQTGKKSSEYTHAYAIDHADTLAEYVGLEKEKLVSFLQNNSHLQLETRDTDEEIREALALCKEKGVATLYLVSSPTHVPRCLLTACQLQEEYPDIVLCGVAAESTTDFWHPRDVVVIEPPHKPDSPEAPFYKLAGEMVYAIKNKESAQELYKELKKVFDAYERK